jgi:mannosylglycerate hydrolase
MTKNKNEDKVAYIVSHSHWDREWRYSLWQTRFLLLQWMDELIPLIENGTYAGFLTDGQVTPVLDYLEVRPQMKDRVTKLVSAGKLEIGPWLYLPDEYPVDGEALVRNLLWGHRKCHELGGICKAGYTSFGWGQTAQLPQIYAGFGIDTAFIGKRVSSERAPKSEFLWESPDGTQLLTTRLGKMGRSNFYVHVHLPVLLNMNYLNHEWEYHWNEGGIAYHRADSESMEQDHFQLDAPANWHPERLNQELIDELWATTDESVIANHRLMMDGCDYSFAQPLLGRIIEKLNQTDKLGRKWIHSTLMNFIKVMRDGVNRRELTVVKGELRDGPTMSIGANASATRIFAKRRNRLAQNKLIRFSEPMSIYAAMAGAEFPDYLLKQAWSNLLQSHPHDSVNCVVQDVTADDVMARLHQSIELSDAVAENAMQEIVKRIDLKDADENDVLLVLFNSLPYTRSEIIEAWVNVPAQHSKFKWWTDRPDDILVYDMTGTPLATQWRDSRNMTYPVAEPHSRLLPLGVTRHHIYFDTGQIPPGGYKIFKIGTRAGRLPGIAYANNRERTGTLLKSPRIMENEFLRVEMNANGTFSLTDKKSSKVFRDLNYFEDRGEIGDYWINERPGYDQVHISLGSNARIWNQESGPLQATIVSEVTMMLPADGDADSSTRTCELRPFTIRTAVTLKAGTRHIEVKLDFNNNIENHQLRVMFPTGLKNCNFADTGGHFHVDRRPVKTQGPTADTMWMDMATLPQNNFVDLSDGQSGFAVIGDDLTEYEVLQDDERTLALTLLRGVKNWICSEVRACSDYPSQKGGQQLGNHTVRYAIMPHETDWQRADIPLASQQFNTFIPVVQTRKHDGILPGKQHSFFTVDNPSLRFSALKKCEDRNTWIARLYNLADVEQQGTLSFSVDIKRAWLTNLNEERLSEITVKSPGVPVHAGAHKIVTIEFET